MSTDKEVESNVTNLPLKDEDSARPSVPGGFNLGDYKKERELREESIRRQILLLAVIVTIFFIIYMASINNPEIYKLAPETLDFINRGYNAIVFLAIPFLLGVVGAMARLLLSGVRVVQESALVVGSGLMAAFAWVGIKSGVLLALIAPHIENSGVSSVRADDSAANFYTMVLVAIFVGMFSTNLYLFISDRVAQLSDKNKNLNSGGG